MPTEEDSVFRFNADADLARDAHVQRAPVLLRRLDRRLDRARELRHACTDRARGVAISAGAGPEHADDRRARRSARPGSLVGIGAHRRRDGVRSHDRRARVGIIVWLLVALGLVLPAVAGAHASLLRTTPSASVVTNGPPAQVT